MLEKLVYMVATLVVVFLILIAFLVCASLDAEAVETPPNPKCYATCYQFESALLVGCYLSEFEGRHLEDMTKRKQAFDKHEASCRTLVKELMGKDSGCKKEE